MYLSARANNDENIRCFRKLIEATHIHSLTKPNNIGPHLAFAFFAKVTCLYRLRVLYQIITLVIEIAFEQ